MPMAEKDTFKFMPKQQENPWSSVKTISEKTEQRHEVITWTVGNYNVCSISYQLDKNKEKKYITHIA